MKRLLLGVSLLLLTQGLEAAVEKIAVVTRVNGSVKIDRSKSGFQDLKAGTVIENGDRIRTGNTGFTALIFIDDKSMLKIKANTEVVINGTRAPASINKTINLGDGILRAQVGKQRKGDFIIQSPTSVASVKGTDFWFLVNAAMGEDQLIGLEGIVSLTNVLTGVSVDVTAGLSGFSNAAGSLSTAPTNPADVPVDPDTTSPETKTQLRIRLEGPNGEEKIILIEYK